MRDKTIRFALALAVAVATPVAILFYFQFQSIADLEQAYDVVLHQRSEEAADNLLERLVDELRGPSLNALQRLTPNLVEPLALDPIVQIVTDGLKRQPYIDAFFFYSDRYGGGDRSILVVGPPDRVHGRSLDAGGRSPGGRFELAAPATSDLAFRWADSEEAQEIWRHAVDLAKNRRALVQAEGQRQGEQEKLVYRLFFDNSLRDHLTSFAGYRTGLTRFRREFLPKVVQETLAAHGRQRGFPTVEAAIVDGDGRIAYQSGPFDPDLFVDERRLPFVFLDTALLEGLLPYVPHVEQWRIRTGYGDRAIPAIAQASTGKQRNIMVALVLIMIASVFFVARAAGRELRLAEMKSNFVASVSHDLKTPLALIQLFAETLELGRIKSSDRVQEYYRIINSEARKLTRLIDNLLDFSRIDAGLRHYRRIPSDLGELVGRVVRSLESQFQQAQVAVTIEVDPRLAPALVDPEAVQQALENLLANAMKYSPDHREIIVKVEQTKDAVVLHVIDRGIGIAARHHRRIFRKFYRIETDRALGPPGTGLGLAIVDHIMRGHGGSVRVVSEPGRGSTFSLRFPIERDTIGEGAERGVGAPRATELGGVQGSPPPKDEANPGDRGRAANEARSA
ncbi:MAG: hypothetical protein HYS05_10850 [Acidobacteria bacterium]|nr:hypothetical protein [Acidobacteriota bacterium]